VDSTGGPVALVDEWLRAANTGGATADDTSGPAAMEKEEAGGPVDVAVHPCPEAALAFLRAAAIAAISTPLPNKEGSLLERWAGLEPTPRERCLVSALAAAATRSDDAAHALSLLLFVRPPLAETAAGTDGTVLSSGARAEWRCLDALLRGSRRVRPMADATTATPTVSTTVSDLQSLVRRVLLLAPPSAALWRPRFWLAVSPAKQSAASPMINALVAKRLAACSGALIATDAAVPAETHASSVDALWAWDALSLFLETAADGCAFAAAANAPTVTPVTPGRRRKSLSAGDDEDGDEDGADGKGDSAQVGAAAILKVCLVRHSMPMCMTFSPRHHLAGVCSPFAMQRASGPHRQRYQRFSLKARSPSHAVPASHRPLRFPTHPPRPLHPQPPRAHYQLPRP